VETVPASSVESLFDDFPDDDEPEVALAVRDIPALDSDLTPDEKKVFVDLLNKHMPLEQRAVQLTKLAHYTDQKRAAVGLRAIQEINTLTGLSGASATEAAPMFQLPEGTKVAIVMQTVEK
jgi:hypothetical protein